MQLLDVDYVRLRADSEPDGYRKLWQEVALAALADYRVDSRAGVRVDYWLRYFDSRDWRIVCSLADLCHETRIYPHEFHVAAWDLG